jgi:hypothetical protein
MDNKLTSKQELRIGGIILGVAAIVGGIIVASTQSNASVGLLGFVLMIWLGLAFYFIPTFVAHQRKHNNLLAIGMLNLFLGWSVIGWVAAMVWACTNDVKVTVVA